MPPHYRVVLPLPPDPSDLTDDLVRAMFAQRAPTVLPQLIRDGSLRSSHPQHSTDTEDVTHASKRPTSA